MAWVIETKRGSNNQRYLTDACTVCKSKCAMWYCLENEIGDHRHVYVCKYHEDPQWVEFVLFRDLVTT